MQLSVKREVFLSRGTIVVRVLNLARRTALTYSPHANPYVQCASARVEMCVHMRMREHMRIKRDA
jgi:hypothetical protein